ncbi:hypothetical protein RSOLAG22IIIB_03247 [Rhizoctonia solani]|uniref:Uncharacterized protein n=1 Tax=Rhizoctonia solani TaxID=456999 RepID=A0A0K6FNP9_9AGAM|nr:hypothetical protein RSOLAG22IIIB_03247 [Rhizoctonia solani]
MSTPSFEETLQKKLRPIAHSPWPIWISGAIFMSTAGLKSAGLPPLYQRIGFPFIFLGAGYVLSTGDKRNGSGISTAWSATYLFLNGRTALRTRSPSALMLTAAATTTLGIYGTEYFYLNRNDPVEAVSYKPSPYSQRGS